MNSGQWIPEVDLTKPEEIYTYITNLGITPEDITDSYKRGV